MREIYGDSVVVIPYVMPGFDLAQVAAERFPRESGPSTVGMVLLKHGFFSFGDTARVAYERMIDLVSRAEAYLEAQRAWQHLRRPKSPRRRARRGRDAARGCAAEVSEAAGFPVVLSSHTDPHSMAFVRRADLDEICAAGPGHARPRDPHQARGAARPRRRRSSELTTSSYFAEHAAHSGSARRCSIRRRGSSSTRSWAW